MERELRHLRLPGWTMAAMAALCSLLLAGVFVTDGPGARTARAQEPTVAEQTGEADGIDEIEEYEVVAETSSGGREVLDIELLAPPGARRSGDDPGAPPYIWQGAPLVLDVHLDAGVSGDLVVSWLDADGRSLATERRGISASGRSTLRIPAPSMDDLGAGEFSVRVAFRPRGSQLPASTGQREIAFAIGEPRSASIDPGSPPAFPWPPPRPATRHALRATQLGDGAPPETLGEAADRLLAALDAAGYGEHSFFTVQPDPSLPPEGFALVTRLEQIEADGTPRGEPERWSVQLPNREIFSLGDFLRVLFTAPEGHYRVIVFTVTGLPVAPSDDEPTRDAASEWLGSGLAHLPPSLAALPWTDDHACTALIYQFHQVGAGTEPTVNPPDVPPARTQLERSGLLAALGGA